MYGVEELILGVTGLLELIVSTIEEKYLLNSFAMSCWFVR
jgi:hypothetical protein